MLNIRRKKTKAFSGIEILLASSVMTLIVVSLLSLLFYGRDLMLGEQLSLKASLIANEGLEAVSSIRNESFNNLVDGIYGLNLVDGQWYLVSEPDQVGNFNRSVTISTISDDLKKASVAINWFSRPGKLSGISLYRYFTRWQEIDNFDCDQWIAPGSYFEYSQVNCDQGDLVLAKENPITGSGLNGNGYALNFSASGDYVETSLTAADLNIDANKPKTVEVWARASAFDDAGALFAFGSPASNARDWSLRTLGIDNRWRVQLWGGAFDIDFTYDSLDKWVHFALVHDGSTTSVYADGVLMGSRNQSLNTIPNQEMTIGWWPRRALPQTFTGQINELRVWDKALTQTEIADNMFTQLNGDETNLVAYFRLDEGSGNTTTDLVNASVANLINNPSWVNDSVEADDYLLSGYRVSSPINLDENKNVVYTNVNWLAEEQNLGRALNFNGSSEYVVVPDSSNLNPSEITLAAWVKWDIDPTTGNSWSSIINKNVDSQYRLQHNSNNTAFEFAVRTTSGGRWVLSTTVPEQGVWYYVVGTYDGTTLSMYVNGALENTVSYSGDLLTSTSPLNIARRSSSDRHFSGQLDNIAIYNRALNASEVLDNMFVGATNLNDPSLLLFLDFEEESGLSALDASTYDHHGTLFMSGSEPYRTASYYFNKVDIYGAINNSDTVEPSEYTLLSNNSSLPFVAEGDNLSSSYLWLRQELSTLSSLVTPRLRFLNFVIESDELVIDQSEYLVVNNSASQVGNPPNREQLVGTVMSNSSTDTNIFLSQMRLIWSGVNSNTRLSEIVIDGQVAWSGVADSSDIVSFTSDFELVAGSSYDIDFIFDRNVAAIDLSAQFVLSDSSQLQHPIVSGDFSFDVNIYDDWTSAYCASVTVSTESTNPVVWQTAIVLDTFPLDGTPYNVWEVDWTFDNQVLTATGLAYNDTVVSGSPVIWGFCANRPAVVGNVDYSVDVYTDWGTGYCANVTVTTDSVSPVSWDIDVDLSSYPVNGTPSNVWSANWSFNAPILTASGVSWNNLVSASSPVTWGYCANRPPPTQADFLYLDTASAVVGPPPLNNRNVSGIVLDNNGSSNVTINSISGTWSTSRIRQIYINGTSIWSGNINSGGTATLSTPYVITPGSGPLNLRLRFQNPIGSIVINDLRFILGDGSEKVSDSISF